LLLRVPVEMNSPSVPPPPDRSSTKRKKKRSRPAPSTVTRRVIRIPVNLPVAPLLAGTSSPTDDKNGDLPHSKLEPILRFHQQDRPMPQSHQVAIVTGGARGIGRSIALRLASSGAAICVNYAAHPDAADQVASEITAAGGRAIVAESDVADLQAVTRMVARTEAELGPITILVNNAGVGSGGASSLDAFDAAQMARMRAVNADSVIHTVRAVAPGMKARGYGRIVNIASNAAVGTRRRDPELQGADARVSRRGRC
jgi:hypothetical protein